MTATDELIADLKLWACSPRVPLAAQLVMLEAIGRLAPRPAIKARPEARARLSLDTERQVFFYEQDHYYLSNFSAFRVLWKDVLFDTAEHVYHTEKFSGQILHQHYIHTAPSAHEAFKYAEKSKAFRRPDWDAVKVDIMRDILRTKAAQHEYVRRKLLQTGDRELIENSWRDDYWGWGENRDGKNMLGRLWMEVRSELRLGMNGRSDK